jgi:D-hexose-6-phosphate mutarotase
MPAKFSKNLVATEIAIGLRVVVQTHCHRHGLPAIREVPIISAKAWFGSKLQKNKAPMIECARRLGWDVKTDHEADALAILDLTLARAEIARRYGASFAVANLKPSVAERRAARKARAA